MALIARALRTATMCFKMHREGKSTAGNGNCLGSQENVISLSLAHHYMLQLCLTRNAATVKESRKQLLCRW